MHTDKTVYKDKTIYKYIYKTVYKYKDKTVYFFKILHIHKNYLKTTHPSYNIIFNY